MSEANSEFRITALEARVLELEEALGWYAEPENLNHIGSTITVTGTEYDDDGNPYPVPEPAPYTEWEYTRLARETLSKPAPSPSLYGDVIRAAVELHKVSKDAIKNKGMDGSHEVEALILIKVIAIYEAVEALEAARRM